VYVDSKANWNIKIDSAEQYSEMPEMSLIEVIAKERREES
jgi:hypothetical protein